MDTGDGDYDPNCKDNLKNPWFSLSLRCSHTDDGTNIPDIERVYYEQDQCEYQIFLDSIYGCPVECGVIDNKLCNNKGICGYDFTNNEPKCFCYNGYESDPDCEVLSDSVTKPQPVINPDEPSELWSHKFTVDDSEILYDMSAWHLNGSDFKIKDSKSEWVFLLNMATYIDPDIVPNVCKQATKPCIDFDYENNTCLEYEDIDDGSGIAFRWNPLTHECQLIGTELKWELYDDSRPAHGLRLGGILSYSFSLKNTEDEHGKIIICTCFDVFQPQNVDV